MVYRDSAKEDVKVVGMPFTMRILDMFKFMFDNRMYIVWGACGALMYWCIQAIYCQSAAWHWNRDAFLTWLCIFVFLTGVPNLWNRFKG